MPQRIGVRRQIVVAMDWSDFDPDRQASLAFNLVTSLGRATPLVWLLVWQNELTGQRLAVDDACLARLVQAVPSGVKTTIPADRYFGDRKLFSFLKELGFGIRCRGNLANAGPSRPASGISRIWSLAWGLEPPASANPPGATAGSWSTPLPSSG
ncbi:MAG: hypothetical protein GC191_13545 [Azospirillum sp.]|nr:hypothetical protein [Azospirillum sp.]